jgi:hypothetical protein
VTFHLLKSSFEALLNYVYFRIIKKKFQICECKQIKLDVKFFFLQCMENSVSAANGEKNHHLFVPSFVHRSSVSFHQSSEKVEIQYILCHRELIKFSV